MQLRTTLYLPEGLHDDLKQLARLRRSNMAELLRAAAEQTYRDDLQELRRDPFRRERLNNVRIGRKLRRERRLQGR